MVVPFSKAKAFLFTALFSRRGFSSSTAIATTKKLPKIKCINRVNTRYKHMVIEEAQKALREYLHATKSMPFVFAELIANNSLFSLANLFPKIHFSSKNFEATFQNLLRYEPINEFEFFFESIGVDYHDVHQILPPKTYFFSQDSTVFDAACALSQFGFPWNMLGKLCVEDISLFQKSTVELMKRLCSLKERFRVDNLFVVGVVLAFPYLLSLESEYTSDIDEIFYNLKRVFVGLDVESCVEGNVDAWYEVCCKVRTFYDLGCEKRSVMELMCESKGHFLKCPKEVLVQGVEYFCKFGVEKVDAAMLLLQSPEILSLDLKTSVISVLGFLEHFGLDEKELRRVNEKCTYVLGRNGMANLPYVMKALDLHEWCFEKIKNSNGQLLATYAIRCPDEGLDKEYVDAWKQIESSKYSFYKLTKFDFLKRVGFGENIVTIRILNRVRGVGSDLQERFDCLLRLGFKHSKLCWMVQREPYIISQNSKRLEDKVNFLRQQMALSLQLAVAWPEFLQYDLNTRIKHRLGVYFWLKELGLCTGYHSVPYMIKSSRKSFIKRLSRIHPAAPKHYLERFLI